MASKRCSVTEERYRSWIHILKQDVFLLKQEAETHRMQIKDLFEQRSMMLDRIKELTEELMKKMEEIGRLCDSKKQV